MKNLEHRSIIKIVIGVILIGIIIGIAFFILFWTSGYINFSLKIDPETSSFFATFYGGLIGTFFAFATIILVWLAYENQRNELSATKQVLSLQQAEMKSTREVIHLQQFEQTYFDLLKTQRVLKKTINFDKRKRFVQLKSDSREKPQIISGDIFFETAMQDFGLFYNSDTIDKNKWEIITYPDEYWEDYLNEEDESDYPKSNPVPRIKFIYKRFFDRYHNYLGHYFRLTYHILNYLCTNLDAEFRKAQNLSQKKTIIKKYQNYADILQAQMSSSELFLMFYNGICFKKSKDLIERFRLLENLSKEDLADSSMHHSLYIKFKLKSRYDLLKNNEFER